MDVFNVFDNELYIQKLMDENQLTREQAQKKAADMFVSLAKKIKQCDLERFEEKG